MPQFRKKPVVIEAVQVAVQEISAWHNAPLWIKAAVENRIVFAYNGKLRIRTLEGVMTADLNDWIIRGVKGELYPCKPDIFEATYEPVK